MKKIDIYMLDYTSIEECGYIESGTDQDGVDWNFAEARLINASADGTSKKDLHEIVGEMVQYAFDHYLEKEGEKGEEFYKLPESLRWDKTIFRKNEILVQETYSSQGTERLWPFAAFLSFLVPDEKKEDWLGKGEKEECLVTLRMGSRLDVDFDAALRTGRKKRENGQGTGGFLKENIFLKENKNFFLFRMLETAAPDFYLSKKGESSQGFLDELWEMLLVYQFEKSLLELKRIGFYKNYVRYENNDSKLKGTIAISRHIRLNMGQDNGKIAYAYRERSVDNSLNHLILRAYEILRTKFKKQLERSLKNPEYRKIISNLQKMAPSGAGKSDRQLLHENRKRISHPFFLSV